MSCSVASAFVIVMLLVAGVWFQHRRRRERAIQDLANARAANIDGWFIDIATSDDRRRLAAAFARDRIVRVAGFLEPDCLESLRADATANIVRMTRTSIPGHKRGKTLSYEQIQQHAHGCLAFYHSPGVIDWVSMITGVPVRPTPDGDQSSLSVLCYDQPGDHINWHYDHNFYRGRHFTVLLSLANEDARGGLSSSRLMRRLPDGDDQHVDTAPNSLVVFEGAKVLHKASPTEAHDFRVMLSMTYCTDPRTNWAFEAARRVKDTAFYGLRALWD